MFERVANLEQELAQVEARLSDPEVLADPAQLRDLSRRHKELDAVVATWRRL